MKKFYALKKKTWLLARSFHNYLNPKIPKTFKSQWNRDLKSLPSQTKGGNEKGKSIFQPELRFQSLETGTRSEFTSFRHFGTWRAFGWDDPIRGPFDEKLKNPTVRSPCYRFLLGWHPAAVQLTVSRLQTPYKFHNSRFCTCLSILIK